MSKDVPASENKNMKIVTGYPPNIEKIKKAFPIKGKPVCFAYGDTLYNASGSTPPKHLEVHEEVHSKQQGSDPEAWWDKYIANSVFRLEQEIEAHHVQYEYYKKTESREMTNKLLVFYAETLSSAVYGNLCTYSQAMQYIKYGK